MKPTSAHTRTVISLFRSLVRAARSIDAAIPALPAEAEAVKRTRARIIALLPGDSTLPVRVVRAFLNSRALPIGPSTDAAVAAAFDGLRIANGHLRGLKSAAVHAADARQAHPAAAVPALSVGHVVVHKTFGYRAVVTAVHARCQASAAWRARNVDVSAEQPFYTLLVDTRDRVEAQVAYAAHESVMRVDARDSDDPLKCFIEHPLVGKFFKEFHARESLYVLRDAEMDMDVSPPSPKSIVAA